MPTFANVWDAKGIWFSISSAALPVFVEASVQAAAFGWPAATVETDLPAAFVYVAYWPASMLPMLYSRFEMFLEIVKLLSDGL